MSALEQRITRPSTHKVHRAAASKIVILGIDIEEANLLDTSTSRVTGDRSHIQHAEPGAVVGLVRKAVGDVLVVVDTLGTRPI